ncbi:MAG: pyridoxal phosphate-dependent decarboxylase family protein, partial [Sarcina sp.]
KNDIDLEAVFLGPKSENKDVFAKSMLRMLDDHAQWRKDFHPEDPNVIKLDEFEKENYKKSNIRLEETLTELSSRLRTSMMPWHSPRYIGHMCSETLMPALLGYFAATLYNGNNVTYEAGPATAEMEEEVGIDFCKLMGYDPNIGWGHISSDGSTANYEAIWYMRNIKSMPLAMKEVVPDLVVGKSDWELLNMSVEDVLDLLDKVPDKLDEIKAHSASRNGKEIKQLGKLIVPQTKHYSWLKGADIMGIGVDSLVPIPVDEHFRMNIDKLKDAIDDLISQQIPILGVVAVVGTTEEGAVDHTDKIFALKEEYAKQGINFYFHVDAAYGGYSRAIFLDEGYNFIPMDKLQQKYLEHGVFKNPNLNWPSEDVYNGFKYMCKADSITVDPHKMGYVPYQAGGIAIKDKRMRNTISYFASYVFQKDAKVPDLLGAFILEGSKPGAAAAAVWTAHRVLPLNITGYGQLLGASIEGAYNLFNKLNAIKEYKVGDKIVEVHTLATPDFNMVDYVLNIKGNKDLAKMNELTYAFYKKVSYFTQPYANDLILSHTQFAYNDYGDSPVGIVKKCGMTKEEWDKVHTITLLRSCVLSPFLNKPEVFKYYSDQMDKAIVEKLQEIFAE